MSLRKDGAIKYLLYLLLHLSSLIHLPVYSQVGQINIDRVQLMPNIPSPYVMRNWKDVAVLYDGLIFSTTTTGQHLPLIGTKPTGTNYTELSPILLQTYVGTNSSNQAEAINIIPAIISASLVGINKSNQAGVNWVEKTKDFYNKTNGQNVYLNSYSTSSGDDWWYDIMPNIFFYQLYSQYPGTSDFDQQFTSVADQWLAATQAMGGSTTPWTVPQMNYRAWNLITMTGNVENVKEPEAAGGIGWLLYHAYLQTGKTKYLDGAQMAMEFLSDLNSNPSYELQLPYGAFIAAKMNAELGTTYDVPKIVNWCFDRGPLRGWGAINGTWNGVDVDGLIGEANDSGDDYAFAMNGFQHAAALVPLIKYDKRFARDIAKWTLNVANASRLFYSQYLPEASQDDFAWSTTNDPQSVIAYEALKEVWEGKPLYGTGDAKRSSWAQTNLGLYGSSHVGYLGSIVAPTDVEGILLLDVNNTDFFKKDDSYPSYALYNPFAIDKLVTITLPSGSHDIYDAISEAIIASGVSGSVGITITANEAKLLVYIPAGSVLSSSGGKYYAGTVVIDHHYGYDFTGILRIKSLAVGDTLVEFNQQVPVYTTVDNAPTTVTYTWKVDGIITNIATDNNFTFSVPAIAGRTVLLLQIESGGKSALDSITFNVVDHIPVVPLIQSITTDDLWSLIGSNVVVTCVASDGDGLESELTYQWTVSAGTMASLNESTLSWQLPSVEGIYEATCTVTDLDMLTTTGTKLVLVKSSATGTTMPYAYYPLDGDVKDYSGNGHHGQMSGVEIVADARGEPGKAYRFDSGSDIIFLANEAGLNFQDQITTSFWVKLDAVTQESFILSHGSWEERWKVSITPDKKLRWTVKSAAGTKDLDSSFPFLLNQYYHIAVVYSGYSMELYVDGELNNFHAHTGLMGTTGNSLTFGRKDAGESKYFLRGTMDEVRLYDVALAPDEISTLKTVWNVVSGVANLELNFSVYPNPVQWDFTISGLNGNLIQDVKIFETNGRPVNFEANKFGEELKVIMENSSSGLLILKISTSKGVFHRKIVQR